MAVLLHHEAYDAWLDDEMRNIAQLKESLRPYPVAEMTAYPASTGVNSPQNHGAGLIKPLPEV
jgi:putative SOS response-associated peptidase YedK